MEEVEGIPLPILKLRLDPSLEGHPSVGIKIDGMGMRMLGRIVDGKEDMATILQIEGPIEMVIDGVGPMALKDGKVDITRMTPVTLVDGLDGSAILDETLGLDMV
jgi:hypothetical protein